MVFRWFFPNLSAMVSDGFDLEKDLKMHIIVTDPILQQLYVLFRIQITLLFVKGWLAIATLKPLVEREFLSTNEKPGFQRVANQTKLLPSPFFYDVSETNDE